MKKFGVLLTIFVCVTALNSVVFAAEPTTDATKTDAPVSTAGGATIKDPTSPEGYTQEAQTLVNTINALLTAAQTPGTKIPDLPVLEKMASAATYYGNLHGTCVKTQSTAKWLCREETSPDLQNTLNKINPLMALFNTVAVKDACDTFGKVMTMAQAGLTAYTAACSAARAACESSCSTVFNNIKQIKDLAPKLTGACSPIVSTDTTACMPYENSFASSKGRIIEISVKENNLQDDALPKSIASKNKACTYTYGDMLISAGTGILSVVRSLNQAKQCDEQSNGTSTAANNPTADTAEKCSKPENAQLPECLCIANPRLPGCANGLQKAGENSTIGSLSALSSPNANSADKNGLNGSDLLGGEAPVGDGRKVANDSSSSGAAGAPMGGGAGLGGSGGGGSGTGAPTGDANGKKGLDANILGGGSGGGGGGGSWGMGGGSGSSDSKLRGYLPGGAQDPNKMAGQGNWTKEVTGQGGKSNWEKVRERYRDNNPTLLNN